MNCLQPIVLEKYLEIVKNAFFLLSVLALRETVIYMLQGLSTTSNPIRALNKLPFRLKWQFAFYGITASISEKPMINRLFRKNYSEEYNDLEIKLMNTMHQLGAFEPTLQTKFIAFGKAVSWGFLTVAAAGISFLTGLLRLILSFC